MKSYAAALALFFAAAVPAAAQDDVDCNNQMAQQDMNYCAAKDYEAADAELNTVWKQARAAVKDLDAELSDNLKGADKALLAGQRGWIAYRDGQCEMAGFEARGGSMEPMLVSGCLADLTRKRTQELKQFITGGEGQ
jgi:uncharacterized protein YecT (DUF1311 family)